MALVIIGTGIAGYTLAREIRKNDSDVDIIMVSADDGANVYKPNLSKALTMKKSPDELVMQPTQAMADQLQVKIMPQHMVVELQADKQRLVLGGGEELHYDQLVLAVGARQRQLPLLAELKPELQRHVYSVNDLQDYRAFHDALHDPANESMRNKHVGIIGGGLIGCEFANDLIANGFRVSVIEPMQWPMANLLPQACGLAVQKALAELGVQWYLSDTVEQLDHADEDSGVQLHIASGAMIEVDVVLSATGLLPNIELAEKAGLTVERGVVVDEYGMTSNKNVFAMGDCMQLDGHVLPYVAPIIQQAKAIAASLTGTPTVIRYAALPVAVKTPACPVVVSPSYVKSTHGEWRTEGEGLNWQAVYYVNDEPQAFVLTGEKVSERMQWMRALPAWR